MVPAKPHDDPPGLYDTCSPISCRASDRGDISSCRMKACQYTPGVKANRVRKRSMAPSLDWNFLQRKEASQDARAQRDRRGVDREHAALVGRPGIIK